MTLNSFYGSIDLSIRAVFRRIFFGSMSNNVGDNLNQ